MQGHEYYLNHSNTVNFAQYDADAVAAAVSNQLPYYLVETNSASCVGIPGVSNAFTSTLWGIDVALQMAYRNHTGVFFHTSGINTLYNVFTAPAYNGTTKSWKTGPIFYSFLLVSEALASTTNNSRVVDLQVGRDDVAAYGIFEGEIAKKVVFINMISDGSGSNVWTANVPALSNQTRVSYKVLTALGVDQVEGIVRLFLSSCTHLCRHCVLTCIFQQTWANQTFGYWSNGILQGTEEVRVAPCNNGSCPISIPAPGAALVFLTPDVTVKANVPAATFPLYGTDNPTIVLNSNGNRGDRVGATSKGSASGALPHVLVPCDKRLWAAMCASILGGGLLATLWP